MIVVGLVPLDFSECVDTSTKLHVYIFGNSLRICCYC